MIVKIELSDEQAAALTAKAAIHGFTLEDWFRQLAAQEAPTGRSQPRKSRYDLAELIRQCDADAPLSAEDRAWMDAPAIGREVL